ncbi:hypothetical protein ACSX1A_06945 [Pontibacter sp. MBLB2868]|uniref:hypothetical protein n=1 Tax=Pontibacter sp. MBLB2868 TaxID=3451555 RepID=UPI003F74CFDC
MMKKLVIIGMMCLGFVSAKAQDDKLTNLMNEREQLVMEYQYYNKQNSNFWGKKSKSDLLQIIGTLKKIINTDSELIAAVKEATIRQMAVTTVDSQREGKIVREDQRIIDSRISDLQSQIKMLQVQLKKKEREVADLNIQVQESSDLRYGKDQVIAIIAGVAFLLLLYAVFLQVRLNKALATGRKKKKV